MKLYGLKNCDTCRKALKTLQSTQNDVAFVDVRADGLDDETLQRFFAEFGGDLVNTRSTTWRGLSTEEREAPSLELLKLHPALMKRPVIEKGDRLTLGWSKDVQTLYS